jgi:hypothetical protein
VNKTLVLQPTTSGWMYFSRKVRNLGINRIRDGFKNLIYRMEQEHLEYDLGSENVIKTLGSVKGDMLTVGERNYSLVVIPKEMENIDEYTLGLLEDYLENGGKILSINQSISRIDGEESSRVKELAVRFEKSWTDVEKLEDPVAMKMLHNDEFEMIDKTRNGMLYHQRRVLDDGQLLFVVNTHQTENAVADISVEGKHVLKLDLITGKEYIYPNEAKNGKVSFQVDIEPIGSALFVITDMRPGELEEIVYMKREKLVESQGQINITRESDNVLMINYLDVKSSRSDKKEIYFMDALIGLFNENGIEMGNPWQHKIQYRKNYLALDSLFDDESWFEASYHFYIADGLSAEALKAIRAVVERPELWQIYINGNEVSEQTGKYWIDKDFPQFAIGEFLKAGKNTITLKASRMHIFAELMPVYILGDFLVKPAASGFEITRGEISSLGSWRQEGLPFYSQKVAYSQNFNVKKSSEAIFKVKLNKWNGSISEIWINGESAGVIPWQPDELDITSLLEEGENEIIVKVTGSLKNTFGFFYQNNDNWIFGPHSWNNAPEKMPPASDYYLMDYGLFEPFELVQYTTRKTKI